MKYLAPTAGLIVIIFIVAFYDTMRTLLLYGGIGALVFAGVVGVIAVVIGSLWGIERWMKERANRKSAEFDTEANKYREYQDGFGMLHLLNVKTGIVENLSTYPGSHHNGKWEEPPANAMLAWHALVSKNKEATREVVAQLPAPQGGTVELLPILLERKVKRVFIKGPTDAGKTTLLQNVADRLTNVFVIDPHSFPGKWPAHCVVIGGGENFAEIDNYLIRLYREMQRRYELLNSGDVQPDQFEQLVLILEEWSGISDDCDNAPMVFKALIKRARKVGFWLYIGNQSERVKEIGLEGSGDLKEGMVFVRLMFNQVTGERSATFDYGEGPKPCSIPSAYVPRGALPGKIALPEIEIEIVNPKINDKDAQIIELIQQGATDSEIARQVFDKPNLQGGNFYKVKELRQRFTTT